MYNVEGVIDDHGKKVYLEANWIDEVPDELMLEYHDCSIYDSIVMLREDGELYENFKDGFDGKYGDVDVNKRFHTHIQHLTAYKIIFHCASVADLSYLDGLKIELQLNK